MRNRTKSLTGFFLLLTSACVQAQSISSPSIQPDALAPEPQTEIIWPLLFISFLVVMLISVVKYFLDFRLKNKLIDKGMSDQFSAYSLNKNDHEKKDEAVRLAIIFCGIGFGLFLIYLSAPIDIHSLAIMSFSLGISYLAYYFYLRK